MTWILTQTSQKILTQLQEKAVLLHSRRDSIIENPPNSRQSDKYDDNKDELALFGGQTRIFVGRLLPQKPTIADTAQSNPLPAPSEEHFSQSQYFLQSTSQQEDFSMHNIHPSLLQYTNLFPPQPLAAELIVDPNSNTQFQLIAETISEGTSKSAQPSSNMKSFDYLQEQSDACASIPTTDFARNLALFDQNAFHESSLGSTGMPDGIGRDDYLQLGMMTSGASGIDEQWLVFMRDSGLMNLGMDGGQ